MVLPAGIAGEKSLVGRKETSGTEGQAHLAPMGVACSHQVKMAVPVISHGLRAVGQKDAVSIRIGSCKSAAAVNLLFPFRRQGKRMVGKGECVGIIHTADKKPLAFYFYRNPGSLKYTDPSGLKAAF